MKRVLVLLVVGVLASVSVIAAAPAGAKKSHPKAHPAKAKKRGVVHGVVEAVGSDSVTLKTKKGASVTIDVDTDTKVVVNHKPASLADVEIGYRAAAKLRKDGGAARWLRASERPAPGLVVHGVVESVGSDSITVKKKHGGDSVTIDVTADTKIRVNGKAGELSDIEEGYRATVRRASANGPAVAIKAYEAKARRLVVKGVVDSVGSDSITITERNGASATIDVTPTTRIRVAGHKATLADIQAGFRALVLRAGADGPALAIIARAPHS